MLIKDLIELLEKFPKDAKVYYEDGDYNGSHTEVRSVRYNKDSGYGIAANTVVLK